MLSERTNQEPLTEHLKKKKPVLEPPTGRSFFFFFFFPANYPMLLQAWTPPEGPHLRGPCLCLWYPLEVLRLLRRWMDHLQQCWMFNIWPSTSEMAALQRRGLQTRILSSEEEEKLKRDQALVSDFKQQKLEKEAQKNWDLFYKRNSTNFFKDRHWTTREFEELRSCREVN